MLTAVRQDGMVLKLASPRLQADREVVQAAVTQNSHALQFATAGLRGDKGLVLFCVQQSGDALQYATAEVQELSQIKAAAGCAVGSPTAPDAKPRTPTWTNRIC